MMRQPSTDDFATMAIAPEGVQYISSWVDDTMGYCLQLMEASGRDLVDRWIENWNDIVDEAALRCEALALRDFRGLYGCLIERGS